MGVAGGWLSEFSSTQIGVPFGFYHYTESTRGQELFIANVPLSNFAGWWLVGVVGVGGYLVVAGPAGAPITRLWPGLALYYAVLGFNLAMTAWINEWLLFAIGVTLHLVLAITFLFDIPVRTRALPALPGPGGRHRKGGEAPLRG